jgi:hypothetical protein
MPSVQRLPAFEPRRSIEEFIQLRREMLGYARAFPPGAKRNQRRQIALSLRGLFKNKAWLDTHVVSYDGAAPSGVVTIGDFAARRIDLD